VTEEQIAISILRMVELEKGVVEGAAATPLAACLSGKLKEFAGTRVVLLLSGGNIDPNVLSRVIERGLLPMDAFAVSPPSSAIVPVVSPISPRALPPRREHKTSRA
jgi:threonine dehydratase